MTSGAFGRGLPAPPSAFPGVLFGAPFRARPGNGLMDTRAPRPACPWTDRLRARPQGRAGGLGETETDVVVPVVGVVPVAVGRAEVLRFVVPGAAADHTLVVFCPAPLRNGIARKMVRRSPWVSA